MFRYDATVEEYTPNGYYVRYDGWGNREEVKFVAFLKLFLNASGFCACVLHCCTCIPFMRLPSLLQYIYYCLHETLKNNIAVIQNII